MNEYKRGFELFKSGYLTEDPAFLLRSFRAALNYKASADSSEKKAIWNETAAYYLGALHGQRSHGSWQSLCNGEIVTHTI